MCVCVCERAKEREREREFLNWHAYERDGKREHERQNVLRGCVF